MSKGRTVAVIALVVGFIAEALADYGVLDAAAAKLRLQGPVGVLIVAALSSPLLRLALILAALVATLRARGDGTLVTGESPEKPLEIRPIEMSKMFKTQTSYTANKLVKKFRGKYLRVTGKVRDVSSGNIGFGTIQIIFERDEDGISVFAYFPIWQRLTVLAYARPGDTITVIGRIRFVEDTWIMLRSSRLVL